MFARRMVIAKMVVLVIRARMTRGNFAITRTARSTRLVIRKAGKKGMDVLCRLLVMMASVSKVVRIACAVIRVACLGQIRAVRDSCVRVRMMIWRPFADLNRVGLCLLVGKMGRIIRFMNVNVLLA